MRENSAERSLYFPPDEKIKTFLTECHINILSMCKLLMENLLLTFELKRQTDIFAAANFISRLPQSHRIFYSQFVGDRFLGANILADAAYQRDIQSRFILLLFVYRGPAAIVAWTIRFV